MSSPAQLRIAARIHYALKGMLGEGIDVAAMLNDPAEAREVLYVCQASGNAELVALANQFFVASEVARLADSSSLSKPKAKPAKAHAAPQDAAWGQDTSGFGISEPADLPTQPNPRTRWLKNFAQRLTR
ncbi:hypothetical protein [Rhizobacter sp. Root1221]|uniref:hypothetical protein n=1 Tax=Rhizobacter sp. Root1221 TaxID=1736433 RepID=UPI0006FE5C48|nr:hypothetical protein [Rhizobacter sp. Root1221]KQV91740.1 hypothetical protein ASC87_06615 [Rhizobacter sp. Root1221]